MKLLPAIGFMSEQAQENWLRELLMSPIEPLVEGNRADKPNKKDVPASRRARRSLPR